MKGNTYENKGHKNHNIGSLVTIPVTVVRKGNTKEDSFEGVIGLSKVDIF